MFGASAQAQSTGAGGSLYAARDEGEICWRAARGAAREAGVPTDLLIAVGLTESGRTLEDGRAVIWPWTVATQEGGAFFATRAEAQRAVEGHLADGRTVVDVGCMQINYHWHRDGFASVAEMLDPEANARYAARHLRELHDRHGDWASAAARYHSGDRVRGRLYADKVDANRAFADAAFRQDAAPRRLDLFVNGARKPLHGGVALNQTPEPILPGFSAADASG